MAEDFKLTEDNTPVFSHAELTTLQSSLMDVIKVNQDNGDTQEAEELRKTLSKLEKIYHNQGPITYEQPLEESRIFKVVGDNGIPCEILWEPLYNALKEEDEDYGYDYTIRTGSIIMVTSKVHPIPHLEIEVLVEGDGDIPFNTSEVIRGEQAYTNDYGMAYVDLRELQLSNKVKQWGQD